MKQNNPTQIATSNTLGIIAFSLSLVSLIVPFLFGGFFIIGAGIILGGLGLRKSPKGLAIAGIIISIGSLLISPTFWLYLAGLSLNQRVNTQTPKQIQFQNQNEIKTAINDKTQLKVGNEPTKEDIEARLNELWKIQTPITKKIFPFAIIKQDDGSYNYYPSVYKMRDKENIKKAFAKKGIDSSKIKINMMKIDNRIILETNAIELSKNPKELQEFLDLYKNQEVKTFTDDNLVENIEYTITFELLNKYRDVITEMNEYSGFSPQLITQNKDTISFSISQQSDGSYGYYPTIDRWNDRESMIKAFAKKGLDISKLTIGKEDIDYRIILEEDAIKSSKNSEKLKEFLNLYKEKNLKKIYISNGALAVEYPVTFDILDTYKDEITEMNVYNGFYPQLVTQ